MIFPREHASKLLYFLNMAQYRDHLVGSPQYNIIEYRLSELSVQLLIENRRNYFLMANTYNVFVEIYSDYKQYGCYFNNHIIKTTEVNPLWYYNIYAEYSGDIDDLVADVTLLWLRSQHSFIAL